jgi:hypothetical protein
MLYNPKIVYICDHSVIALTKDVLNESILKSNSDIDTIINGDGSIESIYAAYTLLPDDSMVSYYEGTDFIIYEKKSIEWISANRPAVSDYFDIEYTKSLLTITQYSDEDCPKCTGNGWYVDLFADNGNFAKKISGTGALVQNFMKILLTAKSADYGSTLGEIPGSDMSNQDILSSEIISIVLDCESTFKQVQSTDIYAGTLLAPEEKLKSATVTSVEFDTDVGAVYLSITLISEANTTADINLIL